MNPEIKARWTAALRSGEYPQTTGALNRARAYEEAPAGFCCLGVLCELAAEDGVVKHRTYSEILTGYTADGMDYIETSILPDAVREWAGLDSRYGLEIDREKDVTLTTLNDDGKSFAQIADLIEESL
jgi:hypothetical protein